MKRLTIGRFNRLTTLSQKYSEYKEEEKRGLPLKLLKNYWNKGTEILTLTMWPIFTQLDLPHKYLL